MPVRSVPTWLSTSHCGRQVGGSPLPELRTVELPPSITAADTSAESPRRRARSLAAFFAGGAGVSALVLFTATLVAIPGWDDLHTGGIAVTVVLAAAGAAILYRWAGTIGERACHLFTAMGTLLIGACQVLAGGGSASTAYGLLYLWIVLHAAMFASRRAVAVQLVLTVLVYAAALWWVGEGAAIAPQLILLVGTQLLAAMVVGSLAANLRSRADTDPLTGLGNRRRAWARLARELERSKRIPGRSTCLAVLDLDDFERLNDRRGRAAGDLVLAELAAYWSGVLSGEDVLTRTGGDEFTLILADCDLEVAAAVVRRLLDHPIPDVTCSAGVVLWDGTEVLHELVVRADAALREARTSGPLVVASTSLSVHA